MHNCIFCSREITNKGSLRAHEKTCNQNPNKIKFYHSPNAGKQKGSVAWNAGIIFENENLERVIQQIESGEYKKFGETHIRRRVKKYLIHKNGHRCMICGLTEWRGVQIPLVSDHIDGNSENNEISNFRIICNNCDSILPTFKAKNIGKGRKLRYNDNTGAVPERS